MLASISRRLDAILRPDPRVPSISFTINSATVKIERRIDNHICGLYCIYEQRYYICDGIKSFLESDDTYKNVFLILHTPNTEFKEFQQLDQRTGLKIKTVFTVPYETGFFDVKFKRNVSITWKICDSIKLFPVNPSTGVGDSRSVIVEKKFDYRYYSHLRLIDGRRDFRRKFDNDEGKKELCAFLWQDGVRLLTFEEKPNQYFPEELVLHTKFEDTNNDHVALIWIEHTVCSDE
jgi:hypothetical protein